MRQTTTRIGAQAWFEFTAILRNGEQVLLNVIMPLLAVIILAKTNLISVTDSGADRVTTALGAGLTLAVMSSAFTSVAIATGFDRRAGFLRYLGTTPLKRTGLLAGKALAVMLLVAIQVVILVICALILGWNLDILGLALALVPIFVATCAFAAWALLLAGTLRAEAVLALANLIWLFLVMTAGSVLASSAIAQIIPLTAKFLPSGGLVTGVSAALASHTLDISAHVVLLAWLAVGAGTTARWFKWD